MIAQRSLAVAGSAALATSPLTQVAAMSPDLHGAVHLAESLHLLVAAGACLALLAEAIPGQLDRAVNLVLAVDACVLVAADLIVVLVVLENLAWTGHPVMIV